MPGVLRFAQHVANLEVGNPEIHLTSTYCHCKSLLCSMFNEQALGSPGWLVVCHHAQNIFKNLKVLYF